ncbi:hypothetical protein BGZ63DRAFT_472735 [Mariannaea sp. PMI_226]|nr:hypothetical protein BGZ63DRAFT_472735 [Mariannaea sp. PMI_226]
MDQPAKEIGGIIRALTQGSPKQQEATLNKYFLPNASFTHPYCRVPSFSKGSIPLSHDINSRWVMLCIYRWYRTLSPRIDIAIDSAAFDQSSNLLYVTIRQTFSVWFIPFYNARVRLVTVLQLVQQAPSQREDMQTKGTGGKPAKIFGPATDIHDSSEQRYYISSQEDLYPITDCLQFVLPGLGPLLWFWWQIFSTFLCSLGSLLCLPLFILLNRPDVSKEMEL